MKAFSFGIILTTILFSCGNPYDKYKKVEVETELSIKVYKHRNERGGSIINDTYLFLSFCPAISENNPFGKDRKEFYFSYLRVPYHLFKRKGEDFFYVLVDNDSIRYQLIPIPEKK